MCGIVGYTGTKPVADILIKGLRHLEYRGYDSSGIAVQKGTQLQVIHRIGKVGGLADAVAEKAMGGVCGIGHTRWATHGRPSL
ncbi:MAG: glutamine--fructose-6-phosphate aminotransferase, partial [Raoultibacter sp.]